MPHVIAEEKDLESVGLFFPRRYYEKANRASIGQTGPFNLCSRCALQADTGISDVLGTPMSQGWPNMSLVNSAKQNGIDPLHFAVGCIVLTMVACFGVVAACVVCLR
jgi:hypothetical protein